MSILDHIRLDEVKKFNNVKKPIEKVCILNYYPRFLNKVIKDYLATHRSHREQVESYCEDNCNNDKPIEEVIHVHEVANLMMIFYVWMTCLEMIWLHIHPSRRKLNHVVRMYV